MAKNQNVSPAALSILQAVANGATNAAELNLRGGQNRALKALRLGRLIAVEKVAVDSLKLTAAGHKLLATPDPEDVVTVERSTTMRPHADRVIAKWHGRIKRGGLIKKLVKQVGLTEASASTYIYNFGKNH